MLAGLTEEQHHQISLLLREVFSDSESEAVLLCNEAGQILFQSAATEPDGTDNIAALVTGSFFAAREVAHLLGENAFRSMLHEGEKKSIYMHLVGERLLLIVIFGQDAAPGLVKLCTERMVDRLCRYLRDQGDESLLEAQIFDAEFELDPEAAIFTPA